MDFARRVIRRLLFPATALSASWLLHAADPRAPFAPYSLGERLIRSVPGGLATAAIDGLGEAARPLLALGIVVGALVVGATLTRIGPIALGALAFLATAMVTLLDPSGPPVLWVLLASATSGVAGFAAAYVARYRPSSTAGARPGVSTGTRLDRRRFMVGAGLAVGLLALGGVAIRRALQFLGADPVRADLPASLPPVDSFDTIHGLSPRVTTREAHYVVDVNLDYPEINAAAWRLRIGGQVDNPLALSLEDLRAMQTVEELATMACISNQVGGDLVGNSLWTGVPLHRLLALARPRSSGVAIKGVGADGYEDAIPLDLAMAPTTLVAFGMDGATLPVAHGFPARLRIPPLYGMKNVKWLTDLVVLGRLEDGYWEKRGWDLQAEVRTESRFDTPADHDQVGDHVTAAGIAWAGSRRISRVEVSTDDGASWKDGILEAELGSLSWRRWQLPLELAAGPHALMVRAYDGNGVVQDTERRPPHPSGASGYHRIVVSAG